MFQRSGFESFVVIRAAFSGKRSRRPESSDRGCGSEGGKEGDGTSQINGGRTVEGSPRSTPKQAHPAAVKGRAQTAGGMARHSNWKIGQTKAREMSGEGIVSIRLPQSLLGAFRAAADRQSLTIHEAARRVTALLHGLTTDELRSLREPPPESCNPRVSLYLGWTAIDVLASYTQSGILSNSQIFRRILFGLLVSKKLAFVQERGEWKLKIRNVETSQKSSIQRVG